MVGVLIIGFLRNGLNLLQVSPFVQQVIIGVVIAIAVAADTIRASKSEKHPKGASSPRVFGQDDAAPEMERLEVRRDRQ